MSSFGILRFLIKEFVFEFRIFELRVFWLLIPLRPLREINPKPKSKKSLTSFRLRVISKGKPCHSPSRSSALCSAGQVDTDGR